MSLLISVSKTLKFVYYVCMCVCMYVMDMNCEVQNCRGWEGVNWIDVVSGRDICRAVVSTVIKFRVVNCGKFFKVSEELSASQGLHCMELQKHL
jgi:hypothetical protein